MACKDQELIKPSIYALLAGFVVPVIGIITGRHLRAQAAGRPIEQVAAPQPLAAVLPR